MLDNVSKKTRKPQYTQNKNFSFVRRPPQWVRQMSNSRILERLQSIPRARMIQIKQTQAAAMNGRSLLNDRCARQVISAFGIGWHETEISEDGLLLPYFLANPSAVNRGKRRSGQHFFAHFFLPQHRTLHDSSGILCRRVKHGLRFIDCVCVFVLADKAGSRRKRNTSPRVQPPVP